MIYNNGRKQVNNNKATYISDHSHVSVYKLNQKINFIGMCGLLVSNVHQ